MMDLVDSRKNERSVWTAERTAILMLKMAELGKRDAQWKVKSEMRKEKKMESENVVGVIL